MKTKILLIIFFVLVIIIPTGCKKKEIVDDDKPIDNPPTQEGTKKDTPIINFNQENYIVGDNLSFNCENYKLDELDFSIDEELALMANNDGTYKVRRTGDYLLTFSLKSDSEIKYETNLKFYSSTFDLNITTPIIGIGDKCEVWVYNFDKLLEDSDNDFTFTIDNEDVASIDGQVLTAKALGNVTITATSKLNPKVNSKVTIKVGSDTEDFILRVSDPLGKICVGETLKVTYSLDYPITDFVWLTSDREILRVTKYDTAVEITGIGKGDTNFSCYLKSNPSIKGTYHIHVDGYKDVDYIDKFIKLAYEQVGIYEGKNANGEYNNITKFGEWYNNNGEPWCATFVSWCWYHAGLSNELLVKYQGCYNGMEWCAEHGIFHDVKGDYYKKDADFMPQSGDVVFFLSNGSSHTGIVAYADNDYIYTIEGNRSNCVGVWRIAINHKSITGYARPHYPETDNRVDQSWIKTTNTGGIYLWKDITTGQSTI